MDSQNKNEFVKDVLFAGLENRNTGFDSPLIPHVSAEDFQVVIDRCTATSTEIIGIEVFEAGGYLVDVVISPEPGLDWARRIAKKYAGQPAVTLCATFRLDNELSIGDADVSLEKALGGAASEQGDNQK